MINDGEKHTVVVKRFDSPLSKSIISIILKEKEKIMMHMKEDFTMTSERR